MNRSVAALSLLASTCLLPAQSLAQDDQQAPASKCDALVAFVEAHDDGKLSLSIDQARAHRREQNETVCGEILKKVEAAVAQTAPASDADEQVQAVETIAVQEPVATADARASVTVDHVEPEVVVRQPTPEILVRQPAPIITIEIPQPEIIVQMPAPAVTVSESDPRVDVSAKVDVVEPGRPAVRYEQEEPQVRVVRAGGEPTVRLGAAASGEVQTAVSGEASVAVRSTDAAEPTAQPLLVSTMAGLTVVNAAGETVGTVERLVVDEETDRFYLVVAHGGFLGLGEAEAVLPLEDVSILENRLVIRDLTDDEIRQLPGWQAGGSYREVDGDEIAQVTIATR